MINFLITSSEKMRRHIMEKVWQCVQSLDVEKSYTLTIKPCKRQRSLDQNSLYWVWLADIMNQTGNDIESLHDGFRAKFLPRVRTKIKLPNGEAHVIERLTSTTELDVTEFSNYLTQIQALMFEMGVILENRDE